MAVGIGIFGVLTSYLSTRVPRSARGRSGPDHTGAQAGAGPDPGGAGRIAGRNGRPAPSAGGTGDVADLAFGAVSTEDPLVPGWLVRLAAIGWRVLVTLALGVVLFGIAGQLATVVASIILALILAATLAPYVAERRARGWGRSKAAGVVSLDGAPRARRGHRRDRHRVGPVRERDRRRVRCRDRQRPRHNWRRSASRPKLADDPPAHLGRDPRRPSVSGLSDFVGAAANVVTIAILGGFLTFFLLHGRGQGLGLGAGGDRRLATRGADDRWTARGRPGRRVHPGNRR